MPRIPLFPLVAGLALAGLGAGVLVPAPVAAGEETKGRPDATLSLSRTSVFEVASPAAVETTAPDPGESTPLARAHAEMPPAIPHAVGDFLPLTAGSNACVDCHAVAERVAGEPIPIPASHSVDLRNAPGKAGDGLVGARFVCLSCHVAPTAAMPLVDNPFGSAEEAPSGDDEAEHGDDEAEHGDDEAEHGDGEAERGDDDE